MVLASYHSIICVASFFLPMTILVSLVSQSCLTPLWDSLGKNTGIGSHSLLQGIFSTKGSNLGSPALQADSLPFEPPGKSVTNHST